MLLLFNSTNHKQLLFADHNVVLNS